MPSLSIIFIAEYISQAHFSCEYIGLASTMKKWHPFQSTVMAKAQPKLSCKPLPRNWEQVHSSERIELTLCKKLENAGDLAGTHSPPPCTCSKMNKVPNDTQLMKQDSMWNICLSLPTPTVERSRALPFLPGRAFRASTAGSCPCWGTESESPTETDVLVEATHTWSSADSLCLSVWRIWDRGNEQIVSDLCFFWLVQNIWQQIKYARL